ncbi:hypothetical protein DFH07DRAFT_881180 [Mycena maculata]|uniref:Uncharacterized protein n=1 Tax=Mycena maculata TaxID=230809 RepID=A0AAD7JJZ2_9AGAR|nr:hypothetical protein DFH07DRAFT_881180 [Mycena maculata]
MDLDGIAVIFVLASVLTIFRIPATLTYLREHCKHTFLGLQQKSKLPWKESRVVYKSAQVKLLFLSESSLTARQECEWADVGHPSDPGPFARGLLWVPIFCSS